MNNSFVSSYDQQSCIPLIIEFRMALKTQNISFQIQYLPIKLNYTKILSPPYVIPSIFDILSSLEHKSKNVKESFIDFHHILQNKFFYVSHKID